VDGASQRNFLQQRSRGHWPLYDSADLGFRNYWYPAMFSRGLKKKPIKVKLLGDDLLFVRQGGKVFALEDRCAHRGVPLSLGRCDFQGTWTCRYHGWVYDVSSGRLVAALTDGPDSPIVGKVAVRTYPVEERAGILWVWMGEGKPVAIEEDIPSEVIDPKNTVIGTFRLVKGDWRYAAENGYDEGHFKYLHRDSLWARFYLRAKFPAWSLHKDSMCEIEGQSGWLTREVTKVVMKDEYPGLGSWPKDEWWRTRIDKALVSIRLPGILRVSWPDRPVVDFEWYVPVDKGYYLYGQIVVVKGLTTVGRRLLYAKYWLIWRWLWHGEFNGQDIEMVQATPVSAPERLYRPDASIVAWRKLCEQTARGVKDRAQTLTNREGKL